MQDAQHFRDQAALCLEIAQQMSDWHAAECLRTSAAQYRARAKELEMQMEPAGAPPPAKRTDTG